MVGKPMLNTSMQPPPPVPGGPFMGMADGGMPGMMAGMPMLPPEMMASMMGMNPMMPMGKPQCMMADILFFSVAATSRIDETMQGP